jgi:hypothetical protein
MDASRKPWGACHASRQRRTVGSRQHPEGRFLDDETAVPPGGPRIIRSDAVVLRGEDDIYRYRRMLADHSLNGVFDMRLGRFPTLGASHEPRELRSTCSAVSRDAEVAAWLRALPSGE